MKKKLRDFCETLSIECVGVTDVGPYTELEKILNQRAEMGYITGMEEKEIEKRINPRATMENCESIIVCLFPYYIGEYEEGNLSKYTRSLDYHIVVKEKLEQIATYLSGEIKGFEFKSFVDSGPLVERYIAQRAGLGFWGINGNLINEKYGSYFFIGYIMTNYNFDIDKPNEGSCLKCMKCVENCPGKVLFGDFNLNPALCKSYLTQKKGELHSYEIDIINKNKMIFGCDVCQDVCPHNRGVKITPISEFKQGVLNSLYNIELQDISNKEFKRKHKDRAFSWRGKGIIERNIRYISENNK